jgi:hypothetical protein
MFLELLVFEFEDNWGVIEKFQHVMSVERAQKK